jgi:hypothetical protein
MVLSYPPSSVSRYGYLTNAKIEIHSAKHHQSAHRAPVHSGRGARCVWRADAVNMDARLQLSDAASVAGVPPGTVRNWRYRGWTTRSGERRTVDVNDDGYRLGDVLQAERDTRRSERSHRRLAA